MLTWLLAAVQMFFLNPLAPLPDVAAVRETWQASMQAEHYTAQSGAGVLPDEARSVEMDWLETQSVCRNSPLVWSQSRRMTSDGLSFFHLLSLALFLSSV